MTNYRLVGDIVKLVESKGLSPSSSVDEKLDWYTYSVENGLVEYVYDEQGLAGFLDWVRLAEIPTSMTNMHEIFNTQDPWNIKNGPVGLVLNCVVVRGHYTLSKLINMARSKNETCQIMVWHDRKHDRMRSFCWHPHLTKQQIKGGLVCKEIVEC